MDDKDKRIGYLNDKRLATLEIRKAIERHNLALTQSLQEIEVSLQMIRQELESLGWNETNGNPPPPSLL